MIQQAKFGEASKRVVIEEFLDGIELSVFVLTDGKNYLILPEAKDYKRVGEGDTGLNTGGMGAVSPVPFATPGFMYKVEERIIKPSIKGLYEEKIDYTGFLFIGLISVNGEPYVIEYNCRLGDPETEAVLVRLETDLVGLFIAATQQELDKVELRVDSRAAATIMAVSHGYPLGYEKGFEITGLKNKFGKQSLVFHAGTIEKDGKILTNGGRVLCVTSLGKDIPEAVECSLEILDNIHFDGMYYRTDIGYEFKNAR
jgi:phosphoribosylamine--glycine ligase